jgi:hypothetical protein
MEKFTENPNALLSGVPDTIDKLKWFYNDEVDQKRRQIAEFLIDIFNGLDVEVKNNSFNSFRINQIKISNQ